MKKLLLLPMLLASPAFGQSVQQSGSVTRNQVPVWVTSGVIGGSQSAPSSSTDSVISSFGVTNNGGAGICVSSDRQTAVGRNQLCIGASTAGPGVISLQNYGTALPQNLEFVVNGIPITIPTGGGTFLFGNGPFLAGDVPCFLNTNGVVQDCGLALSNGVVTVGVWHGTPIAIANGGTGATSVAGAITSLGLGTMAIQNANAVAITGGAVTGMPTPTNPTDVAIKSYVDAVSSGLNVLAASGLATAAVLPNTPTYANGTLGVGATLTSATNTTLTVDGTAAPLNTVILVRNQASAFQNGIYSVTTAGSGSVPWVLTRVTYFDQAAEMKVGSYTFITGGSVNPNTAWTLQSIVTTVGTDPLNFAQFSSGSSGTVTSATISAGTGILVSGTCTITAVGNCLVTNVGVLSVQGATGALTLDPTLAINVAQLALGKYTAASGGVAYSITGRFGLYPYVTDYGAVCDGVTDDTTAIQNALAAVPSGGTIYFPNSLCGVTTIVRTTPINMIGAGMDTSGLISIAGSGTTLSTFEIAPPTGTTSRGYSFTNMAFINPVGASAILLAANFATTNIADIVFDKVFASASSTHANNFGVFLDNSVGGSNGGIFNFTFRNGLVSGGISLLNAGDTIRILDNIITGPNAGIGGSQIAGAGQILIEGNNISSTGGAVVISCSIGMRLFHNEMEQQNVSTEPNNAIVDLTGTACTSDSTYITENQFQSNTGVGNPLMIRIAANTTNNFISDNRISTPASYSGILNASASLVCGNNVFTTGTPHVSGTAPAVIWGNGC